jgi:hypothetical protein
VVAGAGRERMGQRVLEAEADGTEHLADQVVLGREVVDDHPVAHPEPLRQAAERQPAQPLGHRRLECGAEELLLRVLVAHPLDRSDHFTYVLRSDHYKDRM